MSSGQRVCFTCRLSFKQGSSCPSCGGNLTYMGTKFKAPRNSNVSQWRKVQIMVDAALRWRQLSEECSALYCPLGCRLHPSDARRRGILPTWGKTARTLADVKTQLHQRRSRTKVYA